MRFDAPVSVGAKESKMSDSHSVLRILSQVMRNDKKVYTASSPRQETRVQHKVTQYPGCGETVDRINRMLGESVTPTLVDVVLSNGQTMRRQMVADR